MTYIIGSGRKTQALTKEQVLYDEKIQSYSVIGESAHFMKRQKPLAKVGVYCGRFSTLSAKDAVFLGLCKSQCDIFVVVLDSDYAVRLKGDKDADAKERAFLVASLPFVDWVCLYDDTTPDVALNALAPDIIFTGLYARDDIGINIKHDKFKQVEHPFEITSRPTLTGKYFKV